FSCILIRHRYNKRRKVLELQLKSEGRELRIEYSFLRKVAGVPTKFRYKELEEATDNFQAVIGTGSSASVFKGILSDGTSVAVKRSMVKNEFIPNGSLDCWIFPVKEKETRRRRCGCLPWNLRYNVAIDVAKALSYLHHDCRSRILHLDVKPENILLDEDYKGLVADFGLAKLVGKDESSIMTTIRGTRGYLAPEWLLERGISEKTDIYSYGMVLLELIGGRRNVSRVEDPRDKRKLMEIVDQRLLESGNFDESEVKRLVFIALWCIQEKPRLRPSMVEVVDMLEGRVRVEEPPGTRMILVDLLSVDEDPGDDNNLARLLTSVSTHVESNTSTYSLGSTILSGR
ncbi:hypothetical protein RYX36_026777, partial [Vicia faba]